VTPASVVEVAGGSVNVRAILLTGWGQGFGPGDVPAQVTVTETP